MLTEGDSKRTLLINASDWRRFTAIKLTPGSPALQGATRSETMNADPKELEGGHLKPASIGPKREAQYSHSAMEVDCKGPFVVRRCLHCF